MRLLQALAYQMHQEEMQALSVLSEAVRLAEPENYIRSFVDEGTSMAALLAKLREQQCKHGPTPYLDTLLTAFPQQRKGQKHQPKQTKQRPKRFHADD
jgi:LuxR family maltose regulon positive regulatory protein